MDSGMGMVAPKDQFQDQLGKLTEEIFRLQEQLATAKAELELRHKQVANAFAVCFNRPEPCVPDPRIERRY